MHVGHGLPRLRHALRRGGGPLSGWRRVQREGEERGIAITAALLLRAWGPSWTAKVRLLQL